jgi:hypothetical protein
MNKSANAQLRMMSAVVNYLENEVENFTKMPVLQAKFDQLKALQSDIWALSTKRSKNLKGITQTKDLQRERVNVIAIQLSSALTTFAKEQEDVSLEARVTVTPTELTRGAVNMNIDRLTALLEEAVNIGSEQLSPFGWDQERLDSFSALVSNFSEQMTAPRQAIARRTVLTQELYALVDEAKKLFEDYLDKLVVQLSESAPTFVKGYFTIRKVIPFGSRSAFTDNSGGEDDSGLPPNSLDDGGALA